MLSATGATKGNMSSHVDRLEKAGYVEILKSFNGKIPHTRYRLTQAGKKALAEYWAALDEIRRLNHGSQAS
jgi:DNA-binding MarR family transcriptional regulator